MAIMDNGKILFTERKGAVKLYDTKKKTTKLVTTLPVHSPRANTA